MTSPSRDRASTVRIRPARPRDLRHLAAIEDAGLVLFEEHLGEAMVPALRSPAPSGGARSLHGSLLVAEEGERLVGFAHVVPHGGHAHLEQLSVLPAAMRRGIGTALVEAAAEEARWDGHVVLSLCTYRDLPWNGPFYRSLGFTEVARLEPFQADLRARERALRLDENGVRVVLERPLRR